MLGAIARIERIDLTTLHREPLMLLALERSYEIVSEASRHIPAAIKQSSEQIRWQDLADFGNLLRHGYHKVSLNRLVETATVDIPALKVALIAIRSDLDAIEPRP